MKYHDSVRVESIEPTSRLQYKQWTNGGVSDPFHHSGDARGSRLKSVTNGGVQGLEKRVTDPAATSPDTFGSAIQRSISGLDPIPVRETATTEDGWPTSLLDRAAWAFELELSMRGGGL